MPLRDYRYRYREAVEGVGRLAVTTICVCPWLLHEGRSLLCYAPHARTTPTL